MVSSTRLRVLCKVGTGLPLACPIELGSGEFGGLVKLLSACLVVPEQFLWWHCPAGGTAATGEKKAMRQEAVEV